ncbi:MAG: GGDEF domain-containing protein [Eubacterium sp.]|nr:GGDEF domain-containing protein [Eubacterium sp.]
MAIIKRRNIVFVVLIVAAILIILYKNSNAYYINQNENVYTVSSGWMMEYGDVTCSDMDFEDMADMIMNTDSVAISFVMPKMDEKMLAMAFRTNHEVVHLYVNDEEVYSWGSKYYSTHEFIPNMYHTINLGEVSAGDVIRIELKTDHGTPAIPDKVQIGNLNNLVAVFIAERRGAMYCGIFMCVFAFFVIALIPVMFLFKEKDYFLLLCGLFSLVVGAYILSYSDILMFFTSKPVFSGIIEYIALCVGCVIFNLIMMGMVDKIPVFRMINIIMTAVSTTTLVIMSGLHALRIKLFYENLIPIQLIIMVECILIIIETGATIGGRRKNDTGLMGFSGAFVRLVGVLSFMVCTLMDVANAVVVNLSVESEVAARNNYLTMMGAVAFIVCTLLSYVFSSIDSSNAGKIKKEMEGVAYTDNLTMLANRSKCMEVMKWIDDTKHEDYSIISVDMDNLKYINDEYSHEEGDVKLKTLSDILSEAFKDIAITIGRLGGDEFMVIIEGTDREEIKSAVLNMIDGINEENSGLPEGVAKLEVSYGIAYSDEFEDKYSYDVYMKADGKMYDMKERHHNKKKEALYET